MKLTESKYLFDTTVFVDFLRGIPVAQQIMQQVQLKGTVVYYSIITEAELWAGIKPPRTEKDHITILRAFQRYNLNVTIAHRAGELLTPLQSLRGVSIPGIGDALIAATAEYYNLPICTRNIKHFQMFPVRLAPYKL